MELTKKTTISFPAALHERLTRLAESRGTSLGELVRSACEREYAAPTSEERLAAVRRLTGLKLPVGNVPRMKLESVPDPVDLAK